MPGVGILLPFSTLKGEPSGLFWYVMVSMIRKSIAVLAACGLAAGVFAYIASYLGLTLGSIDNLSLWVVCLHIGFFVLLLPIFLVDRAARKDRRFFWTIFSRGMPKWVVPTIKVVGLFFMIHFFLFLIESHAASPAIRNGQYVLDDHGRIVKAITQREYLHLKGAELRIFATGWMFFYFVPLAYWWFPRSPGPQVETMQRLQ